MGNPIFAAAVLSMTVPITLIAAAINFRDETWGESGVWTKFGQLGRDTLCTSLWALSLSAQILGLIFTYSRGPWLGTAFAVAGFLTIIIISSGWRIMIRTLLVLVLSGVLAAALLHWQGSLSIANYGSWLGFVIALSGLAGTFVFLFILKKFRMLSKTSDTNIKLKNYINVLVVLYQNLHRFWLRFLRIYCSFT